MRPPLQKVESSGCSVEILAGGGEEHEVVGENSESALVLA
jgi:hypothetical protein